MKSFSRITSYEDCPYGYYLRYILGEKGESNYWAEVGSLVHDNLRKIAIGEISQDDAPSEFVERYDTEILETTKESTMDAVFDDCVNFFAEYEYEYLERYRVISTEEHLLFNVDRIKFHGYIDLLLQDKDSGDYVVVDYKSCKPFYGKRGNILKSMESTYRKYLKQMCLYCIAVEQNYGKRPTRVMWLHFRDKAITEQAITEEDIKATEKWVADTVLSIDQDEDFKPKKDWFMCHNLCEYRHSCQYLMFEDEEGVDA